MGDRTRAVVALAILGIWLLFYARKFLDPDFPVPAEIGGLAAAALAYVLGSGVIKATKPGAPPPTPPSRELPEDGGA